MRETNATMSPEGSSEGYLEPGFVNTDCGPYCYAMSLWTPQLPIAAFSIRVSVTGKSVGWVSTRVSSVRLASKQVVVSK